MRVLIIDDDSPGDDGEGVAAAVRSHTPGAQIARLPATEPLAQAVAAMMPTAARLPPRRALPARDVPGLLGTSAGIEQVRDLIRTAAQTDAPVLIEGETGTGKEVVARAIHHLSARTAAPLVPLNCAAIPETLAESEFFGHTRGAFTGAVQERPGALVQADRGTLFLDEIEDLPLTLQAKLLRVLQDREVRPVGGSTTRKVDVRLIAASNQDLWAMVDAKTFRRDLYYRLRVLGIQLPPLRDRREDISLLVTHFILRFNRAHGARFAIPSGAQLRPLLEHDWPGNVRELENALESLCILAHAGDRGVGELIAARDAPARGLWVDERTRILQTLETHRWNRQRAAAALGISRVTLWRRMERHGIRDPLAPAERETA